MPRKKIRRKVGKSDPEVGTGSDHTRRGKCPKLPRSGIGILPPDSTRQPPEGALRGFPARKPHRIKNPALKDITRKHTKPQSGYFLSIYVYFFLFFYLFFSKYYYICSSFIFHFFNPKLHEKNLLSPLRRSLPYPAWSDAAVIRRPLPTPRHPTRRRILPLRLRISPRDHSVSRSSPRRRTRPTISTWSPRLRSTPMPMIWPCSRPTSST